jgi:hypothetical protein
MNDIVINKIQSIQRCIQRAREEYQFNPDGFLTNYSRQDAAILNLIRACEQSMVGFRNTVVHEYQPINLKIVITVIETGLDDLIQFAENVMDFDGKE